MSYKYIDLRAGEGEGDDDMLLVQGRTPAFGSLCEHSQPRIQHPSRRGSRMSSA